VKPRKKRQRQAPLYFKTRKIPRIKQGRPKTSTKDPIRIEESSSKKEGGEVLVGDGEKGSLPTDPTFSQHHTHVLPYHS